MIREQPFRFGRADHLVGVAGLSTVDAPVGVVVLNAGMLPRVGPFRLHVDLTRRLNTAGYPTLRMDLSTLGDSGASGQALSRIEEVRADVADAIDLLTMHAGCRRVVLIGLCSGAANAHAVASVDPRVAGVVFLDGYVYRTLGFCLRHYLPRLIDLRVVGRYLGRTLKRRLRRTPPASFEVSVPPRTQVRHDYADMLARGLELCFIYSGGIGEHFNHARQFGEIYGKLAKHSRTCVHYLADTDHTYVLTGDRRRLIETIIGWFAERFPLVAPSTSADALAHRAQQVTRETT